MDNLVISGQPSIIIRCGCDFKIKDTDFKKGQIVAVINECDVDFTYTSKQLAYNRGASMLGATEELELSGINIHSVPFNKMLYKLVFGQENTEVWRPNIISSVPKNNNIVLPTTDTVQNIEVYTKDYQPLEYTFDTENNIITVNTDQEVMVCYYSLLSNGMKINTVGNRLPYFNIECINKGNSIGQNRFPIIQYLHLYSCALKIEPFFLFNDNINNFDLAFNVINNKEDRIEYGKAN